MDVACKHIQAFCDEVEKLTKRNVKHLLMCARVNGIIFWNEKYHFNHNQKKWKSKTKVQPSHAKPSQARDQLLKSVMFKYNEESLKY